MRMHSLITVLAIPISFFSCKVPEEALSTHKAAPVIAIGAGISKITGDSEKYIDPLALQAGVSFEVGRLNEYFTLIGEINGSMQGSKYEEPGIAGKIKLYYINAPMLLRFQVPAGFFAEAGLQPSFLVSARNKYDSLSLNFNDQFKIFDVAVVAGLGVELQYNIGIGARIIYGVTNININNPAKDHNFLGLLRFTYMFAKKAKAPEIPAGN